MQKSISRTLLGRFLRILLATFVGLASGLVFTASPASAAAGAAVQLQRITAIPVTTGTPIAYRLFIACGAVADPTCVNGAVDLALPSYITVAVTSHPWVQSTTRTATGYSVDLVDAIPAGSSAWIDLTMTAANGTTPTSTFTPTAQIRIANGPVAVATSTGSVTSTPNIGILKSLTATPAIGGVARYELRACSAAGDPNKGQLWLQSGQLVDALPSGAVFVAASGTGVYNSTANSVTWTGIADLGNGPCGTSDTIDAWVDVRYPSPAFNPSSSVTNNATVSGVPYTQTATVSATTSISHGFLSGTPTGSASKGATTQLPWTQCGYGPCAYVGDYMHGLGEEVSWAFYMNNTSAVPAEIEFIDMFTCPTVAIANNYRYLAPGQPCAAPMFVVEKLHFDSYQLNDPATLAMQAAYTAGWRPRWLSNTGATGDFTSTDLVDFTPLGLAPGERISEVKLPHDSRFILPASSTLLLKMQGHLAEDIPADAYFDSTSSYVRDHLYNGFQYRMYSGGTAVVNQAGEEYMQARRTPLEIAMMGYSYFNSSATTFQFENWSNRAIPMVGGVLLPPNSDVSYTSLQTRRGYASPGPVPAISAFDVTTTRNYNGTGRTFVRVASKPGFVIEPASGVDLFVQFTDLSQHYVAGEDIPYTIYGLIPGLNPDVCNATRPYLYLGTRVTDDPTDIDGDGRTTGQVYCKWDTRTRISSSTQPALRTSQFVQGNLDAVEVASPNVADISDGGTANFRVDVTNAGTGALTDVWVYDILPYTGDTGISSSATATPRGSVFAPTLTGPIVTAGSVVEYSMSTNPCRPEVGVSTGCTSDWTATPTSWALVRSYRVKFANLAGPSTVPITFALTAPTGLAAGATAFNNVAASATSSGGPLLPVDSPKVGMARPLTDVAIAVSVSAAGGTVNQTRLVTVTARHDTTVTTGPTGQLVYSGPASRARNVAAAVTLPPGLSIVPGSVSGLGFDPATGSWNVGDLFVGSSRSITFEVQPSAIGQYRIGAQITANSVVDIDSTPGDCNLATPSQDDCTIGYVNVSNPGIALRTLVEAPADSSYYINADSGSGEVGDFRSGQPVRYLFEVTNMTAIPLTDVVVQQPDLTSSCNLNVGTLSAYQRQNIYCTFGLGYATGSHVLNATVEGMGAGVPVTSSDDAVVEVTFTPALPAAINIEVLVQNVNTGDAGHLLGVAQGTYMQWIYTVTNTGQDPLSAVTLTDAAGIPVNPDYCYNNGSGNVQTLAVGETTTCWFDFYALAAGEARTITASGIGTSAALVQASDSAQYGVGTVAVDLQFQVFDPITGVWVNADATDGLRPQFFEGQTAQWRALVNNTGTLPVIGARLYSQSGPTCPENLPRIEVGASLTTQCTPSTVTGSGLATYTAVVQINGTVAATDTADINVEIADLAVVVEVFNPATGDWDDGETAPYPAIGFGEDVRWRVTITNVGPIDVTGITINNGLTAACGADPVFDLAINASSTYECTSQTDAIGVINFGVSVAIGTASATDDANADVRGSIAYELQVQDRSGTWVNADSSDGLVPWFYAGETIHLRSRISNTSDVDLTGISYQAAIPACADTAIMIPAADSFLVTCDVIAGSSRTFSGRAWLASLEAANDASVEVRSAPVPRASVLVEVLNPATGAYEDANVAPFPVYVSGSTVSWRVTVQNSGTVAAELSTPLPTLWTCGLADTFTLQPNTSIVRTCQTQEASAAQRSVTLYIGATAMADTARMTTIQPSKLGRRVWLDTNGNDRIDGSEVGLEGITVNLWHNGAIVATTTTDALGNYVFTDLYPGSYTIEYVFTLGWISTVSSSRATQLSMAAASGRVSFTVTVTEGEQRDDANLGLTVDSANVTPTNPTTPGTPGTPAVTTPGQIPAPERVPAAPRAGLPATGSQPGRLLILAASMLLIGAAITLATGKRRSAVRG